MRLFAVWLAVAVLAGGCGDGTDATGPTGEAAATGGNVPPAKKQAAFPTEKVFTNSIGMKFVLIPAGEFMMGSPASEEERFDDETQHQVRITKPFYLGMYEVTVSEFRRFVDDTDYKTEAEKDGEGGYGWNDAEGELDSGPEYTWRNLGFAQADNHPVVNVSWNDAVAFCAWLSKNEGRAYRLPTEAEWEYACRAGTTTRFYHGDGTEDLAAVGNVADASLKQRLPTADFAITSNDGYVFTSPVGSFRPNDLGLYDMHGNVWEWCQDWYDEEYYGKSPMNDPPGPTTASGRVFRGGCWNRYARYCRSAFRYGSVPEGRDNDLGFRVAAVPASQGK